MRRDSDSRVDQPRLEKIDQAFRAYRRRRKGGRLSYPPELRRIAVTSVKGGNSAADVARSAGVSGQSLCNWLSEDRQNPQELTMAPDASSSLPAERAEGMARVHLRSGVLIEVPIRALTPSLLDVFGQGLAV